MFVPAVRENIVDAPMRVETSRLGVCSAHDSKGFAADVQAFEVLTAGFLPDVLAPTDTVEVDKFDVPGIIEKDIAGREVAVENTGGVELSDEYRDGF